MKLKQVLLLLPMLLLNACVFYTTPFCTPEKRVDIPGFEGDYQLELMDNQFNAAVSPLKVTRIEKGIYSIDGMSARTAVCDFNNKIVWEGEDSDHPGLWSSMIVDVFALDHGVSPGVDWSFSFFDRRVLDARKIPYQIQKVSKNFLDLSKLGTLFKGLAGNEGSEIMIIDNSKVSNEQMGLMLQRSSFKLTMLPSSAKNKKVFKRRK